MSMSLRRILAEARVRSAQAQLIAIDYEDSDWSTGLTGEQVDELAERMDELAILFGTGGSSPVRGTIRA